MQCKPISNAPLSNNNLNDTSNPNNSIEHTFIIPNTTSTTQTTITTPTSISNNNIIPPSPNSFSNQIVTKHHLNNNQNSSSTTFKRSDTLEWNDSVSCFFLNYSKKINLNIFFN